MIRVTALALATLFALFAAPAFAAGKIELNSEIFVERAVVREGRSSVVLERPIRVIPGDRLVFVVTYKNAGTGPADDIVITNPIPEAVRFEETLDGSEQVSVDGGRNWARLQDLRIRTTNGGTRPASQADVTHLRWTISDLISAGSSGKLTFRGVVK